MGIISVEHSQNLYWLGRYAERACATLEAFFDCYDVTLDGDKFAYRNFLEKLDIADKYNSYENFIRGYLYNDNADGSSDVFALDAAFRGAYDNALVTRGLIGSESLAYIQLALNTFYFSCGAKNLRLALMPATDYLHAFWGRAGDKLASGEAGAILKCGRLAERIDLYFRFSYDYETIKNEYDKLDNILTRAREGASYPRDEKQVPVLAEILELRNRYKERLDNAAECPHKFYAEGGRA